MTASSLPRVLFVSESFPPMVSGVAHMVDYWSQLAGEQDYSVLVVTSHRSANYQLEQQASRQILFLPGLPNPFRPQAALGVPYLPAVWQIIDQFQPQVIHLHDPGLTAKLILRRYPAVPKIFTNHGHAKLVSQTLPVPQWSKTWLEGVTWKTLVKFANQCQRVTVPSQFTAQILQQHDLVAPCQVISYGVDRHLWRPAKAGRQSIRRQLHWSDQETIFYYHGRIHPEKRLPLLLSAFAQASRADSTIKLVIAGQRTSHAKHLQTQAQQLGISQKIEWHFTPVPQIEQHQAADYFVIPSDCETLSIVTLQALATGLPVLAAKAGALPELIEHQQSGWLFDQPDELVKYLLTAARLKPNQWQTMSDQARQSTRAHDRLKSGQRYLKVYQALIQSRARSSGQAGG